MTREQIVAEALSWVGTPFHPHGYAKGPSGGCSCETCAVGIYRGAGLLPPDLIVPQGSLQWSRANKESLIEPFIDKELSRYFDKVGLTHEPEPGDLLGFQPGACVHHLGVFVGETSFVHCLRIYGVHTASLLDATWMQALKRVWRPRLSQDLKDKILDAVFQPL